MGAIAPVLIAAGAGYAGQKLGQAGQGGSTSQGYVPTGATAGKGLWGNLRTPVPGGGAASAGVGQQGITGLTDIAKRLQGQGQQLFGSALPGYQGAMNFYTRLMASPQRAAAGSAEALAGVGRGLERRTAATLPPGGVRDQAVAEAQRQTAGQIGGLYRDAPLAAAQQLGNLSQVGLQGGVGALTGAMSGYSPLLGYALGQRGLDIDEKRLKQQKSGALGSGIGGILGPILISALNKGKPVQQGPYGA